MLYLASFVSIASGLFFDLFARAGGGGSSSGGSGGGGSLVAAMGYLPAYYVAKLSNRLNLSRNIGFIASGIAGLLPALLMATLSKIVGLIVLAGAVGGMFAGMNDLHARLLRKRKKSKVALQVAASADPAWQSDAIRARIEQVFMAYQADWSSFNTARMQSYLTQKYVYHAYLIMKALHQMGRRNNVANPQLLESFVVDVRDSAYDDQDTFTAYIKAVANDELLDAETGQSIYADKRPFEELWRFERRDNEWMLSGISQLTANEGQQESSIKNFANANSMYYSLDWGWLLLPKRGSLFGKANFKKSDINNHVIGEWDGLLVQLYTYVPAKNNQRNDADTNNYLIGQINLPKMYGGIIIRRRSKWSVFSQAPRGYQQVRFEWPDFNKRYDVFATDMDRVTSFELLNPAFMAELYDANLRINIEVVDNLVYFYCGVKESRDNYEAMLNVLKRSFAELKR